MSSGTFLKRSIETKEDTILICCQLKVYFKFATILEYYSKYLFWHNNVPNDSTHGSNLHRRGIRRGTGDTCPLLRFSNKQRSALFIFRKCPVFLTEKIALEVLYSPKFEILPTSLATCVDKTYGCPCRCFLPLRLYNAFVRRNISDLLLFEKLSLLDRCIHLKRSYLGFLYCKL